MRSSRYPRWLSASAWGHAVWLLGLQSNTAGGRLQKVLGVLRNAVHVQLDLVRLGSVATASQGTLVTAAAVSFCTLILLTSRFPCRQDTCAYAF